MLVVGMQGLTAVEWQTHFSLWAISAAPLWAGVDLATIAPAALAILLNREAIAIDQDPLGVQGRRVPSVSVCCHLLLLLSFFSAKPHSIPSTPSYVAVYFPLHLMPHRAPAYRTHHCQSKLLCIARATWRRTRRLSRCSPAHPPLSGPSMPRTAPCGPVVSV